jgi:hypothetical protein
LEMGPERKPAGERPLGCEFPERWNQNTARVRPHLQRRASPNGTSASSTLSGTGIRMQRVVRVDGDQLSVIGASISKVDVLVCLPVTL